MNDIEGSELSEAMTALLNPSAFEKVVSCAVVHSDPSVIDGPRTGLLHVRFSEDKPQIDALGDFLWRQCMFYALPRKRRLEYQTAIAEDFSVTARVHQAVRDTFIEFNKDHPTRASEVGEVMAYCVAQKHLSAAQVAAKMALKTSPNMPIHGLDGIHATFEAGEMTVYFLESKLAGSANSGVREYAKSSAAFSTDRKQYLREYQIVSDLGNFDSLTGQAREAALAFFDVHDNPDAPRRERYVGVICYSESRLFNDKIPVSDGPVSAHETHFAALLKAEHGRHKGRANKQILAAGADPSKSIVFFVAVPDVNALRRAFYRAMGVDAPDQDEIPNEPEDDEVEVSDGGEDA